VHKKLRQQMGPGPAPRQQALTKRICYYHTEHLGIPRELTTSQSARLAVQARSSEAVDS